jgi:hypothetical protein
MSIATLEQAIVAAAQIELNNPKLRIKDIIEWSTSEKAVRKNAQEYEVVVHIPDPGVWIAVLKSADKREAARWTS